MVNRPTRLKESEIKAAYEHLVKLMSNILVFDSDSPEVPYVQGEIALGMIWNGSAYLGNKENPNIQFIYPKEGAICWTDNDALPKTAQHVEGAYQFFDLLLRPKNAKIVIERMGFSIPNEGVKPLISPEMMNNPILFPSVEEIQKSILQTDVGKVFDLYEKYWNKLKTN